MKEKVVKKKVADKKKNNDKNKEKKNKFKSDIIMIYCYHTFGSALNMSALSKVFKGITVLMSFVKALIDSKITVNKTIISISLWKIIIDSKTTGYIFFNKNFIFNFKPISFYVETESGKLL